MTWSPAHSSEYSRLASEMAEDAKWQLQLFTFGVTSAPVLLTLLQLWQSWRPSSSIVPIATGWFFLAPLLVLIPTSLIILNRARTRNRKAAFIVLFMDPVRLSDAGVPANASLSSLFRKGDLPWESALLFLERARPGAARKAHTPPAVLAMLLSYFAIEAVCWTLAWLSLSPTLNSPIGGGMLLAATSLICIRIGLLWRLRSSQSIQAYVVRSLDNGPKLGLTWPQYLVDWRRHYCDPNDPGIDLTTQGVPQIDGLSDADIKALPRREK